MLALFAVIATVAVSPNPASPYEPVTVTGCGYDGPVWLTINDGLGFGEQQVDPAGCFRMDWFAGPADEIYRVYGNAKHHGQPLAETTLVVR